VRVDEAGEVPRFLLAWDEVDRSIIFLAGRRDRSACLPGEMWIAIWSPRSVAVALYPAARTSRRRAVASGQLFTVSTMRGPPVGTFFLMTASSLARLAPASWLVARTTFSGISPGEVGDAGSMARVLVMLEGILTPTGRAKLVR